MIQALMFGDVRGPAVSAERLREAEHDEGMVRRTAVAHIDQDDIVIGELAVEQLF